MIDEIYLSKKTTRVHSAIIGLKVPESISHPQVATISLQQVCKESKISIGTNKKWLL